MTAQEYHDHAKDMRELSYAAWLFKLLRADGHTFETFDEEQGWPDGVPVRRFVAWQYAMSRDARVRNTDEAVAIARKLQDDDESLATRFVCATVLGQDEKRRELDRQMTRDDAPRADLSLIVWYLATAAEASAADRELATELAMQLIASSADTEQRTRAQDLLAATYAARGMFGQAIENQRRLPLPAVKDQGRRRAMRARMALYKGLAAAPAGDWFDLDSLRNPASRDALLQLMREAPDPDLRKEAEDLLRITFGADMGAESVPEPLSQPPTQVF
jgi:hypothetical protein